MQNACIFVSSSDNTFDVFDLVSPSLVKNWPVGEIDCYVGLNQKVAAVPFKTVSAPVSGWRTELAYQIDALPNHIDLVILVLDDFYFSKTVDAAALEGIVAQVNDYAIDYVRLVPVERSGLGRIALLARQAIQRRSQLYRLKPDEPYYSSLQAAVWRRTALSEQLHSEGSIWEFEHRVPAGSRHFATRRQVASYRHLVEKGKWFRDAPKVLGISDPTQFEKRGFDSSVVKHSKLYNKVKFFLFGYLFFRLRRALTAWQR